MPTDRVLSSWSKQLKSAVSTMGTGTVIIGVLIVAWELTVRVLEIGSTALPAPSRVILEIWRNSSQLQHHTAATALESAIGLLLAVLTALPLSFLTVRHAGIRRLLRFVCSSLWKIPLVAVAPLMVIWFGFGLSPAIAVTSLLCALPIFDRLQTGLNSIPVEIEELLATMGASSYRVFTKVRLPACLPFVSSALKTAVPLSLAGAVVTEFVGSDTGLGYMLMIAGAKADSSLLFAALTILVLMALLAQGTISLFERMWITWPALSHGRISEAKRSDAKRVFRNRRE